MRIFQALLSPRIGGAETAVSALEDAWSRENHTCTVGYLEAGEHLNPAKRYLRLRREIRLFDPDIIVSHSALPNIYARLAAGRQPVVCVLHSATRDFDDTRLKLSEAFLQRRTHAVIAVSEAQKEEYLSHFPNQNIFVIPNGVSPSFAPNEIYNSGGPIVTVGRVVAQKDPALWAEVAAAVSGQRQSARFDWFGPTGADPDTANLVRIHSAEGSTMAFRGPTNQIREVLRSASVFFHPARREAHSIAVLEAAASGLPIVCSTEVAATLPGWLPTSTFDAGNTAQAIRAMYAVLDDLASWRHRALDAAPRVHEEFGLRKTARGYLEVMRATVGAGEP